MPDGVYACWKAHAGRRVYAEVVTTNSSDDEGEPRWQQPAFQPEPTSDSHPYPSSGQGMQPYVSGPVVPLQYGPPSVLETIVATLARLVWPVGSLLVIFAHVGFFPVLITAVVAGALLGAVKKNLRQRRRAVLPPPGQFGGPNDLR